MLQLRHAFFSRILHANFMLLFGESSSLAEHQNLKSSTHISIKPTIANQKNLAYIKIVPFRVVIQVFVQALNEQFFIGLPISIYKNALRKQPTPADQRHEPQRGLANNLRALNLKTVLSLN